MLHVRFACRCADFRKIMQKSKALVSAFSQNPKIDRASLLASLRIFAEICAFSQKKCRFSEKNNVNFRKNRKFSQKSKDFRKIGKFSQKSAYLHQNRQIFSKIGIFSQKSANFRKRMYIFAKSCKFSQKSANFRKNLYVF